MMKNGGRNVWSSELKEEDRLKTRKDMVRE